MWITFFLLPYKKNAFRKSKKEMVVGRSVNQKKTWLNTYVRQWNEGCVFKRRDAKNWPLNRDANRNKDQIAISIQTVHIAFVN